MDRAELCFVGEAAQDHSLVHHLRDIVETLAKENAIR